MKATVALVLFLTLTVAQAYGQMKIGYPDYNVGNRFSASPVSDSEFRMPELPGDSMKNDTTKAKLHSPKKAAIMSALLPGLGQVYNKKAWKLAIIYPAIGGLAYSFGYNQSRFKYYRDALRIRYDDDPTTIDPLVLFSDDRIVTMKNYYQRYRDLSVIGFAAVYVLQIIDASVDAHLFYFDVGPDLSMNWRPDFTADRYGSVMGVHANFQF